MTYKRRNSEQWKPLAYLGLIQPRDHAQKAHELTGGYYLNDPQKVMQPLPWLSKSRGA